MTDREKVKLDFIALCKKRGALSSSFLYQVTIFCYKVGYYNSC
jgi:hypothetical protein